MSYKIVKTIYQSGFNTVNLLGVVKLGVMCNIKIETVYLDCTI